MESKKSVWYLIRVDGENVACLRHMSHVALFVQMLNRKGNERPYIELVPIWRF